MVKAALLPAESSEPRDAPVQARASNNGNDSRARARRERGIRPALRQLLRSHLLVLGTDVAAEDAVSTVFTRALAAGPRYDDPSLRSWLFAIAHNVVANAYRAERPGASLESAWDLPDRVPLLEETVIVDDERDRLLGALRRLPEDQRRVLELRLAGLTGLEIAHLLNRSHGAVKMLQLRAYARLRDILADAAGDEEEARRG